MSRDKEKGDDVRLKLPAGQVLTDFLQQPWILGKSIGVGGCAEIYDCSSNSPMMWFLGRDRPKLVCAKPGAEYAIKVELSSSAASGNEMKFYNRFGTTEEIEEWKTKRKLKFLGMPKLFSYGEDKFDGKSYRFLVLKRFGNNLKNVWAENGKRLSSKAVLNLGIQILDVLEYIHDCGSVHNDIKASNVLVDLECCDQVYLVDFGLAFPYLKGDGTHKPIEPNPDWAHFGTLEFTSRDAHLGRFTRRADLEMLAYTMLKWSSGKLPWEAAAGLDDCEAVETQKNKYLNDVPKLLDDCYGDATPCSGLRRLFEHVVALGFEETPDYDGCRAFLKEGLAKEGFGGDRKLDLTKDVGETAARAKKSEESESEDAGQAKTPVNRKPCTPVQSDRVLRSAKRTRESTECENLKEKSKSRKNCGKPRAPVRSNR